MHRFRSGIVGMVLAGVLTGCGGASVDEGTKGFTPTDVKPYEGMLREQQDKMKNKDYTKKSEPEKAKEPAKKK